MPVQRPFNEHVLWQGKIQKSNYPNPNQKPPMILPKINSIIGGTIKDPMAPPIWEEMNQSYTTYSKSYWFRVKDVHNKYRAQHNYPKAPSCHVSFSPYEQLYLGHQIQVPHASLEELATSPLNQFS